MSLVFNPGHTSICRTTALIITNSSLCSWQDSQLSEFWPQRYHFIPSQVHKGSCCEVLPAKQAIVKE